jgi:hypothetical protein
MYSQNNHFIKNFSPGIFLHLPYPLQESIENSFAVVANMYTKNTTKMSEKDDMNEQN